MSSSKCQNIALAGFYCFITHQPRIKILKIYFKAFFKRFKTLFTF